MLEIWQLEMMELLDADNFNEEQKKLVLKVFEEWISFISVNDDPTAIDSWERDQWYTFNQSGLFEKDRKNKTEIIIWEQWHTRRDITEVPIPDNVLLKLNWYQNYI
jgi:hypothetical protein